MNLRAPHRIIDPMTITSFYTRRVGVDAVGLKTCWTYEKWQKLKGSCCLADKDDAKEVDSNLCVNNSFHLSSRLVSSAWGGGGGWLGLAICEHALNVMHWFYTGNSLTEFLRNEHLVVVGNDLNGTSKMWITPRLSATSITVTVPIGPDYSISFAYAEQSSRTREL